MPDYIWIFLNLPEYAGICMNMPKFAFCFTFPHLFYYPFSTYLFERLQETKGYSLKEDETVFLK